MKISLPVYKGNEPYVFVSYSHADEEVVFAEIRWLQEQGVNVWYDTASIGAGSEWSEVLAKAIEECSFLIFFITPNSVASENCRREVNFAIAEGRNILAVHLAPTDVPRGLRLSLDNRQAVLSYSPTGDYRQKILSVISGATQTSDEVQLPPKPTSNTGFSKSVLGITFVATAVLFGGVWLYLEKTERGEDVDSFSSTFNDEAIVIALLPFEHLSPEDTNQWWVEGFRSEVANHLQKLSSVRLISPFVLRNTLAGDSADLNRLKDLGATRVVNGQVTIRDDKVSVSITGSHLGTGEQILSLRYTSHVEDYIELQSEAALEIAGKFRAEWTNKEKAEVARPATKNLDALALKTEARFLIGDPETTDLAISLLERATEQDPLYTDAWGMLSWAHKWKGSLGSSESWIKAANYAERAMSLDPNNGWARFAQGLVDIQNGRMKEAIRHFRVGAEHAPTLTSMIDDLSLFLTIKGELVEGLKWGYQAYLLWPTQPNSRFHLALTLLGLNELERTRVLLEHTLSTAIRTPGRIQGLRAHLALLDGDPQRAWTIIDGAGFTKTHPERRLIRAHVLIALGDYDAALTILTKLAEQAPNYGRAFFSGDPEILLAHTLIKTGNESRAHTILDATQKRLRAKLSSTGSDDPTLYLDLVATLAQLGELEEAMVAFRAVFAEGGRAPHYHRIDPLLEPLKMLPEYEKLLVEMEADVARQRQQASKEGLWVPIDLTLNQMRIELALTD